jgi:predicted transposase YbfD/YdcC
MDQEAMGRNLLAAFATVPDPRLPRGRRHPLPAVLALATAAMLCGARSLYAIAQWGRLQPPAVVRALGFTRERTPAVFTLHEVFSQLDGAAFEAALRTWVREYFGDRREAIAIDGKALRGIHGEALPGADLVAAYAREAGLVLAQSAGTADQGETEQAVAPALLALVPLQGQIVTADALHCQPGLCRQVQVAGGDYLILGKENQPQLYADIALLFAAPPLGERFATVRWADRHGDRTEVRQLWASTALTGYLTWLGVAQVCKVERVVQPKGQRTREVRYAITSLATATAAQLLHLIRGHWGIENRRHYVRDVTFGEDASRIRTRSAPQVMAALRNVVLGLLRQHGWDNIAAALRHYAWQPTAALRLLGLPP